MAIEKYDGSISIQYALKIFLHVMLRNSELRGAYWPEIDFDKAIWTVPASRGDKHDTGMKTRIPHAAPTLNPTSRRLTGQDLFFDRAARRFNDEQIMNIME
jgi:integrase